jgi:hypothetical protein
MALVLLQPNRSGTSVQKRYIESGKIDFCIDDGERVEQLIDGSMEWENIESGTTIVMRVIFEQMAKSLSSTYICHLCGASNEIVSSSKSEGPVTDGSVDWFVCGIR